MKVFFYSLVILWALFITSCSTADDTKMYEVTASVSPSNAGTISPAPDSTYEEGTEITLQAQPKDRYVFSSWSGDIDTTRQVVSLTVDQDYDVTAHFELKEYNLWLDVEGGGTIYEKVIQQPSKEYQHGTVVELTARAAEGWELAGWKGDLSGSENPVQITVDEPKQIVAEFEIQQFGVTTSTKGEGTVKKEPDQPTYEYGTEVTVTAQPVEGWNFLEWQGDATGTQPTAQLTVDGPKEAMAVFEEQTFSVTTSVTGNGRIEVSPDQPSYTYNEEVEFTAIPEGDHIFLGWDGDLSGSSTTQTVAMTSDMDIKATFNTVINALSYQFYPSVIIGDRIYDSRLSLINDLPGGVLLEKFIVQRADGSLLIEENVNKTIASDEGISYNLSFGIAPTKDEFETYTVQWVCEYEGEQLVKEGGVTSLSPFKTKQEPDITTIEVEP